MKTRCSMFAAVRPYLSTKTKTARRRHHHHGTGTKGYDIHYPHKYSSIIITTQTTINSNIMGGCHSHSGTATHSHHTATASSSAQKKRSATTATATASTSWTGNEKSKSSSSPSKERSSAIPTIRQAEEQARRHDPNNDSSISNNNNNNFDSSSGNSSSNSSLSGGGGKNNNNSNSPRSSHHHHHHSHATSNDSLSAAAVGSSSPESLHRRRKSRHEFCHSDSKVGLNEILCGDLKNPNLVRIEVPLGQPIEEVYEGVHDGPVLGSGISGIVRLVKHRETQVSYAVKCLDLALIDSDEGLRQLKEEVYIMCQLDHPNIIRLEEVYESHSEIYLVQEVCSGGELFDRLDEQPDYHYTEAQVCLYMCMCAHTHTLCLLACMQYILWRHVVFRSVGFCNHLSRLHIYPYSLFPPISLTHPPLRFQCARLVKQMLSSLRYIHNKGIIHRDLKV
jgi:hypothetical protein